MARDLCADIREDISASLDNEISLKSKLELAEHLSGCARCTAYRDSLQRARASMRLQLVDEDVPDLTAAIMQKVTALPRRVWWRPDLRVTAVAAAVTVLVLGGFVLPGLDRGGSVASASDIAQSVRAAA
ncbi:MAG: zf-HC2 domain-containing protein, partial [Actinomycetota bacterium]